MAEKAVARSVDALRSRDQRLAYQVIAEDRDIDEKRLAIEEKCIELTATQQPMGGDLRIIVAVLNIVTDLERIGDYAAGIAKIAVMLGDEPPLKPLLDLPRMAQKTNDMLRRSLQAFLERDVGSATLIASEDNEVDIVYDHVFQELLVLMKEEPRSIARATRLIWVAHNLERSADRVTNICERVIYIVTGKMREAAGSRQ